MTVSTGAVAIDSPAANAAVTEYGTAAAARTGSPVPAAATGILETTTSVGATLGGIVSAAQQATRAADAASASSAGAKSASGTKTKDAKSSDASGRKLSRAARQRLKASKAVAVAKSKIGAPYRYGGTGPYAFDCSGFVQYAWRKAGVRIPRVTTAQYRLIKRKVSWNELRPGDLLFFHGKGHVGMYVGKGRMIHSPSSGKRVRIDRLSAWRRSAFSGAVRPGL